MLTWVTYHWESPRIEKDLIDRSAQALERAGQPWAVTTFTGRDAVITGLASDESGPTKALETIRSLWGVRVTDLRTDIATATSPYTWSAKYEGGRIDLSGFLPGEDGRAAVVSLVRANFPSAKLVDGMKISAGGPRSDQWNAAIGFGMTQLAGLKRGSVRIDNRALTISGDAADLAHYKAIQRALTGYLPGGLKVALNKVSPPVVAPFVWSARFAQGKVLLSGYAPSERVQNAIFANAKKAFPQMVIVDRTEVAGGAPDSFAETTARAFALLKQLKDGAADLRGGEIMLSGTAASEEVVAAVRRAIESGGAGISAATGAIAVAKSDNRVPAFAPSAPDTSTRAPATADKGTADKGTTDKGAGDKPSAAATAEQQTAAEAEMKTQMAAYIASRREAEARANLETTSIGKPETEAQVRRKAEAKRCESAMGEAVERGVILFERARAELDIKSEATLDKIVTIAKACPEFHIEVGGHTDGEGEPQRNQNLSERRAGTVVSYLKRAGVEPSRLKAVGYGATHPRATNDTDEGRAKNRRIEFTVLAE